MHSRKFLIVIIFFALSVKSALAFKTYPNAGGAIHEKITRTAIVTGGPKISEQSFKPINIGNTKQDDVLSPEFLESKRHFDDCAFQPSLRHIENCYREIDQHLCNADTDVKEWTFVLNKFGELLHPIQDFYSHSNYVELQLKGNGALLPAQLPLVNWKNLLPAIRTGFFYYKNGNENEMVMPGKNSWFPEYNPDHDRIVPLVKQGGQILPNTRYASGAEYEKAKSSFAEKIQYLTNPQLSVLHCELNKDNVDWGHEADLVNPRTNTKLFNYAFDLAVRETSRQWQRLEAQVRKTCPNKADAIIKALREGIKTAKGGWKRGAPKIELNPHSNGKIDVHDSSIDFTWTDDYGQVRTHTFTFQLPDSIKVGQDVRIPLSCPPAVIPPTPSGDTRGITACFYTNDNDMLEGGYSRGSKVEDLTDGMVCAVQHGRMTAGVTSAWWGFTIKKDADKKRPFTIRLVADGPDLSGAVLYWTYLPD